MKYLLLSCFFLFSLACFAQNLRHVVYYKKNGQVTTILDSALYTLTISDPDPGSTLYNFKEAFLSGEIYRTGKSLKPNILSMAGEIITYYLNGKKANAIIFTNNFLTNETIYYPNGIIYLVETFNRDTPDPLRPNTYLNSTHVITCNDSTGKPLIVRGNGHFISYHPPENPKFKVGNSNSDLYVPGTSYDDEQGTVKNELRDGQWKGKNITIGYSYTDNYKDGKFISGTSVNKNGKKINYTGSIETPAEFVGGNKAFYKFLGSNIVYPQNARANNIHGIVYASFIIEKDGSLSNIKIMRSPDKDLGEETLRVLKLSPSWNPGMQRGVFVRSQYTVPVNYSLNN